VNGRAAARAAPAVASYRSRRLLAMLYVSKRRGGDMPMKSAVREGKGCKARNGLPHKAASVHRAHFGSKKTEEAVL
jgi:hypothetical protein